MLSLNSRYVYSWILHGDLTITVERDNHGTLFKLNFRKSNARYRLHVRVDFSRLLGIALFLSYNHQEQPTCTFTLETFDILISVHYDSSLSLSLSLSVSFFLFVKGSNEYIFRSLHIEGDVDVCRQLVFPLMKESQLCSRWSAIPFLRKKNRPSRAIRSRRFFYRCTYYTEGDPTR